MPRSHSSFIRCLSASVQAIGCFTVTTVSVVLCRNTRETQTIHSDKPVNWVSAQLFVWYNLLAHITRDTYKILPKIIIIITVTATTISWIIPR